MAEDIMTKQQAAAYLHISVATLERWMRAGLLPVVKLQGRRRVLFRKAALDQVLQEAEGRRTPGAGDASDERLVAEGPSGSGRAWVEYAFHALQNDYRDQVIVTHWSWGDMTEHWQHPLFFRVEGKSDVTTVLFHREWVDDAASPYHPQHNSHARPAIVATLRRAFESLVARVGPSSGRQVRHEEAPTP
jgi:excisionase family DNA binding protein